MSKGKDEKKAKVEDLDPYEKLEAEGHQLAMIAATFANDQLSSKKQTLDQYVKLADDLKNENATLLEELQDTERESLQVVEFLRKEVEKKQDQIDHLTKQLELQREEMSKEFGEERDTLVDSDTKHRTALEEAQEQIKKLEEDLAAVETFKKEKYEIEQELKRLRENESAQKESYERELSKLRYQSLEEKVRLKNEELAMEQRFQQDVERRAHELLDEKVRAIHRQNRELLEDKGLLEKELEQLSESKKAVDEENKRKQRDLELNQQSLDQSAQQGFRLNKEIKELGMKNRTLANNLTNTVNTYEAEKTKARQQFEQTNKLREQQLAEAHQMIHVRTQELHRVRALAKHIVNARSELETFFNEALEYVKLKIAEEGLGRSKGYTATGSTKGRGMAPHPPVAHVTMRDTTPGPGAEAGQLQPYTQPLGHGVADLVPSFGAGSGMEPIIEPAKDVVSPRDVQLPPISASPMSQTQSARRIPAEKVDISDLTWEDKERVLRILFAKINSVQSRKSTKKKPLQDTMGSSAFLTQSHH
mmetsp:Transcript_140674/g.245012  ORF Transcript_140674/g.245012 Transcript_140674/m.245012 type:complete len:533 (-) Transcript_140674:1023-2621(-)